MSDVTIGAKGARFYEWQITLAPNNDPRFVEKHLPGFLARIRTKRRDYQGADALVIEGSDAEGTPRSVRVSASGQR